MCKRNRAVRASGMMAFHHGPTSFDAKPCPGVSKPARPLRMARSDEVSERLSKEDRQIIHKAGGRVLRDGSLIIPLTKENMLPVLNAILVGQGRRRR